MSTENTSSDQAPAARPPGLAGLAQDMVESDAAFRAQFDPTSSTHHGGDKTTVPSNAIPEFGGGRVPDSMGGTAAADWRSLPEAAAPAPEDFGPEVALLTQARSELGNLKKALNDIGTAVTAVSRAPADAKAAAIEALSGPAARAEAIVSALRAHAEALLAQGFTAAAERVSAERWADAVATLVAKANEPSSHTDTGAGEFAVASKPHTAAVFNAQGALLQEIKAAKKRHADAKA